MLSFLTSIDPDPASSLQKSHPFGFLEHSTKTCKPFNRWIIKFPLFFFSPPHNFPRKQTVSAALSFPINQNAYGCSSELSPSVSSPDLPFWFFLWVFFAIQNPSDCTQYRAQEFPPAASAFRRRPTQKKLLAEVSFRQCLLGSCGGLSVYWWRRQGQLWASCILEAQATGGSLIQNIIPFADLSGFALNPLFPLIGWTRVLRVI